MDLNRIVIVRLSLEGDVGGMSNRRKVTVKINNREYTVVGYETEEYIKSIAEYVDVEFKKIYENNERLTQLMAAILTAFNIADRYCKTNQELSMLKEEIVEPLKELDDLRKEISILKERTEKLQYERDSYKEELFKTKKEIELNRKKIIQHEQALKLKEDELQKAQRIINDLQNKLFENQIELVQTKKELGEFLKSLDEEVNK